MTAAQVTRDLRGLRNPEKAVFYPRFFKTGKGGYGEGDRFLGVVVPDQRKIARRYRSLPENEIVKLLDSPYHECRLTGLLIMVQQFEHATDQVGRKKIYDLYLEKMDRVNNWDLVDASAHKIVGAFLENRSRRILHRLAASKDLWQNRISIIATLHFIKQNDLVTTLEISQRLVNHPHDLIHKAVGWMLRELGKQDLPKMLEFLQSNYEVMPRTMLRYAIEKLPPDQREQILAGQI